jgi:type VI secretion system secreted protein VgrG
VPVLKQSERLLRIYTPLGDDVLVPRTFEGAEGISHLYEFRIEVASENGAINPSDIVGKRVTLSVLQADAETERYFDGFVSHFTKLPRRPPHRTFFEYELKIVPWTWFLTRTTNCCIFQDMTVPAVIEQIFSTLSFTDFETHFSGTHNAWTYCVQYRETAFNFISRLMEKEGIFYFFKHEKGKHTMILGDKISVHQNCDYQSNVPMDQAMGYIWDQDTIQLWERHYQYRSGKWAQTDYNFETPTTSLLANDSTVLQLEKITNYELFDYPGEYDNKGDGETLVKLRMEEEEIGFDTARGEGDCRSFSAGFKFTLEEHEQKDQNQAYVLLSVMHRGHQASLYGGEAEEEPTYQNTFECFPATVQFRPARKTPRSIVHGTQTAVVVGPGGEEIYTDNYGRVKVQFFWDRVGQKNEKSSCWIRVSQPWAGKNWGGIWIPRIGQEVVVDFLEGDPDRPLIVGRVYNEQQGVPYTLPANSTQSGFLSRSSKGGGTANFNELRFEDKAGSEEIFLQAEKDLNIIVEHDQTRTVQHDETVSITHDRTEKVGNNETGDITADRKWTIGGDDKLTVTGNQTVSITGNQSITVTGSISITSNQQITLTCGANTITMGPSGISIQGSPIVEIN